MKMKTAHVVTCLALLTTACGTADFSVAVADSGTPDTDPMTVDVQTKPDANHFTFTVGAGLTSPATGTIYVFKPTVTAGNRIWAPFKRPSTLALT